MNPDSSETGDLLKKFAKAASWWRRFFESKDAQEIHQIISELSPLDFASLDQRVRGSWRGYSYYNLHNWQNLQPSGVARLAQSNYAVNLVGLASFHGNGHIREAAVIELDRQRSGEELPFLLIRLNDWVPQVREAATKAMRTRVEPAYATHLLANITLVFRLRACGRVDKKFVDDICSLLKLPECKDVLLAGTKSRDKTIRRISFQLAAEAEPASRSAIILAAIKDPDAAARSWAVRHFLPEVLPDDLPGVVEPLFKDSFMPVRRAALWFAATRQLDISRQPLRDALLDNYISMRETARQFLDVAGVKSARDFYVDRVANGNDKQLCAAICGLGETGTASDVTLIVPTLNSPLAKIRRAVVYAVGRLDLEGQLELLVGALSDMMPSVSREALKALQTKARTIPLADLENLLAGDKRYHTRRNALTLLLHSDKWKKIPALLKACADKDSRIAEQAAAALRAWLWNYNVSFAEPTPEDFQRISSGLSQFESYLPYGFAADLRASLKVYFK